MLSRRLSALRRGRKLTQSEVALFLGVTRPAYAGYESGRRQPDYQTLIKLAQFFGVSVDYMLGHPQAHGAEMQSTGLLAPIIGAVVRGEYILAEDNVDGYTAVPAGTTCDFAVKIQGEAMSWAGLSDGDVGLFREAGPRTGSVVAALTPDNPYPLVRFYLTLDGQELLKAGNPTFMDIPLTKDTRIVGELVCVMKSPPSLEQYTSSLNQRGIHEREWREVLEIAAQAGVDGQTARSVLAAFIQLAQKISTN